MHTKKTAKETAKTAAKEASKETAKAAAKEGTKVAAKVGTTVAGTAETEALNVSINEFGTVNLAYMQSIYHPGISDIIKEVSEKTEKTEEEINLSEQLKADFERQKMIKELEELIFRRTIYAIKCFIYCCVFCVIVL